MNFYKYFAFLLAIVAYTAIFPHFSLPLSASEPLSIFFISESVEGGQLVTIKNISSNKKGNWRVALAGENAAYFRINGQRADFECDSDNYVQLPHSLSIGEEWGFMLTSTGLPAGQYSIEAVLWTTQGQTRHPSSENILGRTMLIFVAQ